MKTTAKLWAAIIFIAIAGLTVIVDITIIFPIMFGLAGIAFALWFYHDMSGKKLKLTEDFKYWLENQIKNWNEVDIEYVSKDPDQILDPRFLVYFIDEYPQYSLKDIFGNYEKFLNLAVEVCKKFI